MAADQLARVGLAILLRRRIRRWWRSLLVALRIRRVTPAPRARRPSRLVTVPALDTGGAYRPKHRPQDPAKDPHEPYGSESSSRGTDHGWSGCTMSSAADALAYATGGRVTPWGGDMRHRGGTDLEGGTDLWDAAASFEAYGERLTVKSGAGWGAVKDAHADGRAIVIQGTGQVPGAGDFDGGHACCIGPETHGDGRWLWGDPLVTDWQWIEPGAIRSWAERWQSSVAFAVTDLPPEPEPEPEPPAPPHTPADPTPYGLEDLETAHARGEVDAGDAAVVAWVDWLRAGPAGAADAWDAGSWSTAEARLMAELAGLGPCDPLAPASWSRGPVLSPVADALTALRVPATWDGAAWRATLWSSPTRMIHPRIDAAYGV